MMMHRKDMNVSAVLVTSSILGAIVLPALPIGSISVRLADLVVLGVLPFILVLQGRSLNVPPLRILFFAWIAMVASTMFGYLSLGVPVSNRDINELLRMAIPWMLLAFCVTVDHVRLRRAIELVLLISAPFVIAFSLSQFIFPLHLPELLLEAYGAPGHVERIITRPFPRIIATGTDPNIGATILLLYFYYFAVRGYIRRKLFDMAIAIVFLSLIGMAASRTVVLSLALGVSATIFLARNVGLREKALVLVVALLSAALAWLLVDYVRIGFQTLLQGENSSVNVRISRFEEAFQLFSVSPIFGWGPAKAVHPTVGDGEYALLLRRYGLVGTGLVVTFLITATLRVFRSVRTNWRRWEASDKTLGALFVYFSASMLVVMITNNFLSGYQLAVPYVVLLGFHEAKTGGRPAANWQEKESLNAL